MLLRNPNCNGDPVAKQLLSRTNNTRAAKKTFRSSSMFACGSLLLLCACLFLDTTFSAALADSKAGASVFEGKCVGCHTVGKGALVGPDLAGSKSWPDEKLKTAIKSMEKTVGPLSDEEVANLLEFLKNDSSAPQAKAGQSEQTDAKAQDNKADSGDKNGGTKEASQTVPDPAAAADKDKQEIASGSASQGEMLFDGRRAFKNGGMSCNACHSVDGSGSSMGPDLANIAEKLNENALLVACQQTPFKVMKSAYAKHPVSKEEALDLVSYFQSIKGLRASAEKFPVALCGGAGSLLILLTVAIGYRNRNSSVRKKLHRR